MTSALPLLSPLVTKVLQLSGFPPELKTRDIQAVFAQWEDEKGGFKIKWVDDTTALIIFAEPATGEQSPEGRDHARCTGSRVYISPLTRSPPSSLASTCPPAKRAYLHTLMSPPPLLMTSAGVPAKVRPYDGTDASSIIASVQNRPRSRSNAGAAAIPAYGGSAGEAAAASTNGSGARPGSPTKSSGIARAGSGSSHLGSGHRRTHSGSNPTSLPAKPVAAALFDAANGGPSPAQDAHLPVNPLASAVAAARVGQPAESARSGKGGNAELHLAGSAANASAEAEEYAGPAPSSGPGSGRIGDAGKRLVAGALGVRHPGIQRSSSSASSTPSVSSATHEAAAATGTSSPSGAESGVEGVEKALGEMKVQA